MWERIAAALHSIFSLFVKPKIDGLAETAAIRRSSFRAIVRFRADDYARKGHLEEDAARGMAQRVIEELEPSLDFSKLEADSKEIRDRIERAVTLNAVPLSTWVIVSELSKVGKFDARIPANFEFRDCRGTVHSGQARPFALQEHFLFQKPFIFTPPPGGHGLPPDAYVTTDASSMAEERLKQDKIKVTRFEVSENSGDGFFGDWMTYSNVSHSQLRQTRQSG